MAEVWKDVVGYEGVYQISNKGRVKSLDRFCIFNGSRRIRRGNIMKPFDNRGYLRVGLYKDSKQKKLFIHRLVAEAFIPRPAGKDFINHIDGDPKNNRIENLEWCTPRENTIHAYKTGLMPFGYKGEEGVIISDYNSGYHMSEIAQKHNIHHTTVKNILSKNGVKIVGKKTRLLRNLDDIKKVLELRAEGVSYKRIGDYFGVSKTTVMKLVKDVDSGCLSKE